MQVISSLSLDDNLDTYFCTNRHICCKSPGVMIITYLIMEVRSICGPRRLMTVRGQGPLDTIRPTLLLRTLSLGRPSGSVGRMFRLFHTTGKFGLVLKNM